MKKKVKLYLFLFNVIINLKEIYILLKNKDKWVYLEGLFLGWEINLKCVLCWVEFVLYYM